MNDDPIFRLTRQTARTLSSRIQWAFRDVADHWAKEAVNEKGSRMVVSGIGNDLYNPDQAITRAEFAAIMVRALGLKAESGQLRSLMCVHRIGIEAECERHLITN